MSEKASGEANSDSNAVQNNASVTCRLCGESYKNNLGVSTHFRYKHPDEHRIPEQKLRKLYKTGLSMREMAEELNTSKGSIQVAFDTYDIAARKSYRDDTYPPQHTFDRISDSVGHEYEIVRTSVDYNSHTMFIHRLIAVAHGKLKPSELKNFNRVVHHKSEHGLDNRPSNLKVMDRGNHQSMHVKKRRSSD